MATPPIRDLQTGDDGDISLVDGDLATVTGLPSIQQDVASALRFFQGEWFADQTLGFPWFQRVLGKPVVAPTVLRDLVVEAIEAVSGVLAVVRAEVVVSPQTRTVTVTWTARASEGELTGSTTLSG